MEETNINLSKEKRYIVNGRLGQYELTTVDNPPRECFFMDDNDDYEYFTNPKIIELKP